MLFTSILSTETGSLTVMDALLCVIAALILGIIASFIYTVKGHYTKNFVITIALLPAIVCVLIMMVNGNLGTGIAVLGVFSLVRFRSQPGTSRDILSIMFAMAIGLSCGMGYITFAIFLTVIIGIVWFILFRTKFAESKSPEMLLKITIPENLEYNGVFDDLFEKYLKNHRLEKVKTSNMGSLYELNYIVSLNDINDQKKLIDDLRCRNGNLPIIIGMNPVNSNEL